MRLPQNRESAADIERGDRNALGACGLDTAIQTQDAEAGPKGPWSPHRDRQSARKPLTTTSEFMRDNWLSNRVFTSYDDIVGHCCEAYPSVVGRRRRAFSILRTTDLGGF